MRRKRTLFGRIVIYLPVALAVIFTASCTQDLLWSDDVLSSAAPAENMLEITYEVESTVYRYYEDENNPLAKSRSVPVINRERVDLKMNRGGQVEIFTEKLPSSTSFEINESLPSTEKPARFYHYKNGVLKTYDKNRTLLSEIQSSTLNDQYTEMAANLMEKAANMEGYKASLTAGVLWDLEVDLEEMDADNSFSSHRSSSLRNEYDDHDAYRVIRKSYMDNGMPYTSELIVHKDTKTLRYLTDYDHNNEAVMRCFFKYGFENGKVQLKAVYEEHIINDDILGRSKEVIVSNYDYYNINFNL